MPLNERIRRTLEQKGLRYEVMPHREAFTAQGVAAASHVSGWQMAKVVMGKDDRGFVMAVVPASCRLDLPTFRRISRRKHLVLATEEEMAHLFPDCEPGAMPPFGNLYDVPVYADTCFAPDGDLVFQAGNHHEVVRMSFEDYRQAACPVVTDFCRR